MHSGLWKVCLPEFKDHLSPIINATPIKPFYMGNGSAMGVNFVNLSKWLRWVDYSVSRPRLCMCFCNFPVNTHSIRSDRSMHVHLQNVRNIYKCAFLVVKQKNHSKIEIGILWRFLLSKNFESVNLHINDHMNSCTIKEFSCKTTPNKSAWPLEGEIPRNRYISMVGYLSTLIIVNVL